MKTICAMQMGLVPVVLLLCLLAPRPGAGILLVPLPFAGAQMSEVLTAGTSVTGGARMPGALVVKAGGETRWWNYIGHGFLPVSVPLALCQ